MGDGISIKASSWSNDRIYYWAEDGYDDHRVVFRPRSTKRPLTLRKLIEGLDGLSAVAGGESFSASPDFWYSQGGSKFVEICSDFYPELETWYKLHWHGDDIDEEEDDDDDYVAPPRPPLIIEEPPKLTTEEQQILNRWMTDSVRTTMCPLPADGGVLEWESFADEVQMQQFDRDIRGAL